MKQADKAQARALIEGFLAIGKATTIRSIYDRIAPGDDGKIRSVMSPVGTETGRFSHSETFLEASTNLANLPKKTAAADPLYAVRECILPEEGRMLWKADYSRAEARWCAYLARDPRRIAMYEQGIDDYRYFVAVLEWEDGDRWQEVDKKLRNVIGKVGILSGQYKVSWRTMMDTVNADADSTGISITAAKAKKMCDIWPQLFPATTLWWREVEEEVLTKGYLINPFGRKRTFFGRTDTEQARSALVREAIAFGPQSANADCLNAALRRLYEKHDGKELRLLLQVHDELVGDCAPADYLKVARIVQAVMEEPVACGDRMISIPAEVSVGWNWAKMRSVT